MLSHYEHFDQIVSFYELYVSHKIEVLFPFAIFLDEFIADVNPFSLYPLK